MSTLKVLDPVLGDKRISWDKGKPDEVELAKAEFDFLTKERKYLAYRVDRKGKESEKITEFDPTAEEVILRPQLVGG